MKLRLPPNSSAIKLLGVLALFTLTACSPQGDPNVLATWLGGEVSVSDLDDHLSKLPAANRQPSGSTSLETWLEERVGDLVLPQAVLQRSQQGELEEQIPLRLRSRYLASQQWGRQYLLTRCPEETIPETELRQAFDETFPQEPRAWILLRHIYKRSLPSASPQERQQTRLELEGIQKEILGGASFLEMARQHSDSETARDGGLIGRISRQAPLDPKVRAAAWALEDGTVSRIVEVKNGFHLMLRESSGTEAPTSFQAARAQIQSRIALRRQEQCGGEILQQLGLGTAVTIDRAVLAGSDDSAIALTVGGEGFSLEELAGLSPDNTPLALTPRPGESVRHFAEALLLTRAAQQEGSDQISGFEATERQTQDELLRDAQWRIERRTLVEALPNTDLLSYFEAHRERFQTDLLLDTGLILVSSGKLPGRRAALESAQGVAEGLAQGETFEQLAIELSEHGSREAGGRIGLLPLPRLRIILGSKGIAQVTKLRAGEISPPTLIHEAPVATYGLVKLYERIEPQPRSFDEAREDVILSMAQSRIQQLDQEVRAKILSEVELQIHKTSLQRYLSKLQD